MNKLRGEHSFIVDGETFVAKLTINSLCSLEAITGGEEATSTLQSFARAVERGKINFTLLRSILWASIIEKHQGKTLQDVGDMILSMTIPVAVKTVIEIIRAAFPDAEGGEAEGSPQ